MNENGLTFRPLFFPRKMVAGVGPLVTITTGGLFFWADQCGPPYRLGERRRG
jgi:hypothetical protein